MIETRECPMLAESVVFGWNFALEKIRSL